MEGTTGGNQNRTCSHRHVQVRKRIGALLAAAVSVFVIFSLPLPWDQLRLGIGSAFASSSRQSLWATASNARYKDGNQQDVDIYVIAEDNDICPDNLSAMTLYLKNNTDRVVTDGELTFDSRYIRPEDGVFFDYSGEEADFQEENDQDTASLKGITLEPGQWREIFFEFYTEGNTAPARASVTFRFEGQSRKDEEEDSYRKVRSKQRFCYSIGLPAVNLELKDGDWLETGITQEMNIWMSEPDWQEWTRSEDEEEEPVSAATQSQASAQATPSQAQEEQNHQLNPGLATDSQAASEGTPSQAEEEISEKEEEDLETIQEFQEKAMEIPESRVRYEIEVFGTEWKRFRPRKAEELQDLGWISCTYRLADDARPGIYYGKVRASGTWNRESFVTEQGFLFEITGEGKITLKDQAEGAEIEISGPASSFPEAEELELKAGTLGEEETALLRAADPAETQIFTAVNLELFADGDQAQLEGPVTIRISHEQIAEKTRDLTDDQEPDQPVKENVPEVQEPPDELPDWVMRQGPGVAAAYLAGEDVTAPRRISDHNTLIASKTADEDSQSETETEEEIALAEEAGLRLLALEPEYGQVETLDSSVTEQGRIQTETDYLSQAYAITGTEAELLPVSKGRILEYEDDEIYLSLTIPGSWEVPEEAKLTVQKIASVSNASPASAYQAMLDGAEDTLSHGVFSAAFYDIQVVRADTAEPISLEALQEDSPGEFKVEAILKTGLPDTNPQGQLEVLHYDNVEETPLLLSARTGRPDETEQALQAAFKTDSLGGFAFVWANPVAGVQTGGPGNRVLTWTGVVLMAGAVWLWKKEHSLAG